jgi:membrane protease YdiL (CAAX protease family)
VAVLACWALLAYGGGAPRLEAPAMGESWPGEPPALPPRPAPSVLSALRLRTREPVREVGIGLLTGIAAWALVLAAALALFALVRALGGEALLPSGVPPLILYVARQPWGLRLGLSVSAGVVEEGFFRGFLQPRLGLGLTTVLFVLAHAGYGQPLQLVAVGILSVIYGLLTRWRGNIWAAAAAHALFDAVQLLVIIPAALEFGPGGGIGPA